MKPISLSNFRKYLRLCDPPTSAAALSLLVSLAAVLLPADLWELALALLSAVSDLILALLANQFLSLREMTLSGALGFTETAILLRVCTDQTELFGLLASTSGLISAVQVAGLGKAGVASVVTHKLMWCVAWGTAQSQEDSLWTVFQSSTWVCFLSLCAILFSLYSKEKETPGRVIVWATKVCESLPGLIVLDSRLEVQFVSPSLQSIIGGRRHAMVFLDTNVTMDGKSLKSKAEELASKDEGRVNSLGVTKTEKEVMSWTGVKVCEGNDIYIALHCTDITTLWKSEESSRSEVSAKNTLLRSVTHELRTPLNAITNLIQDIRDTEKVSQDCEEKLIIVNTSSKLLLHLVNDILDMSQMMAGKLRVVVTQFNPREVFKEMAELFSYQCEKRGLSLELDLSLSLPIILSTDPNRLSQILANLLSNALKYPSHRFTKQGGIYISVDTPRPGVLRTQVRDTGVGMTEAGVRQLFQPFAKLEDPEHLNSQGCGLGLNICYGLVKALGGTDIAVTSEVDIGSMFEFEIPVTVPSSEFCRRWSLCRQTSWRPSKPEDLHILVVDDNTFNTMTVKMMLNNWEVSCTEAYSVSQALALVAENDNFSMILMDLQMPEVDGYQGLAKLVEMEKNEEVTTVPPVIACSANSAESEREHAIAAGFTEYAEKPLTKSALLTLLRSFTCTD